MFEDLTRENVDRYVVAEFGRPKWRDARVKLVEHGGRRAVLKDVRDCPPLVRFTLGRRLIAREFRIYRMLEGAEGVPRAYRMIDRDAFLVEHIDGQVLSRKKVGRGLVVGPEFYERCLELVAALHRRGVVHLDLRNTKNVLFCEGGRPYLVDFASAIRLPGWLPCRERLLGWLGAADRAGVLKMKERLSPELLSDAERRFLRRFERVRSVLLPHSGLVRAVRRTVRRRRRRKTAKS